MVQSHSDEEPQPRRNLQPVEKIKNGAERFRETHEDAYKEHERPSRDMTEEIKQYCNTKPTLHNELRKRKSLANVQGVTSRAHAAAWRKRIDSKSRSIKKSKRLRNRRGRSRRYRTHTPADTPHQRKRIRYYKFSNLMHTKSCQYVDNISQINLNEHSNVQLSASNIPEGNSSDRKQSVMHVYERKTSKPSTINSRRSKCETQCSGGASTNPDSWEDLSFSSQHSYESMDQEPMELNRLRRSAISLGFSELLASVAAALEREVGGAGGAGAEGAQLAHAAAALRDPRTALDAKHALQPLPNF